MKLNFEELLDINVEDSQWLDVIEAPLLVANYINSESLLDWIASAAWDSEFREDEIATMFSFDTTYEELVGLSVKELLSHINEYNVKSYFEQKNNEYCTEHNLCNICRSKLKDAGCPQGCI